MLLSKLREAWICLKAGRVTLPYPFEPHDPPPGFRGKLEVDPDLCFGCGGCANVCPAGVIEIEDLDQMTRALTFHWSRCTYCGRCADMCPEGAITMSPLYETATDRREDLLLRLEVFMGPCGRCGRCFPPPGPMERMMVTGFRSDATKGRPEAWSRGPLGSIPGSAPGVARNSARGVVPRPGAGAASGPVPGAGAASGPVPGAGAARGAVPFSAPRSVPAPAPGSTTAPAREPPAVDGTGGPR